MTRKSVSREESSEYHRRGADSNRREARALHAGRESRERESSDGTDREEQRQQAHYLVKVCNEVRKSVQQLFCAIASPRSKARQKEDGNETPPRQENETIRHSKPPARKELTQGDMGISSIVATSKCFYGSKQRWPGTPMMGFMR